MSLKLLSESEEASMRLAEARVLYTDLDGTLLGFGGCLLCDGQGQPSLAGASGVIRLNEAGLTVVIVSGRNTLQLAEISRLLGWKDYIGEMGCVIVRDWGKETSYDLGEWPSGIISEAVRPYELIARFGAIDALTRHFPGLLEYHDPHHLNRQVTHLLRGDVDLGEAQMLLDSLPDLPLQIVDNGIVRPKRHGLRGVETVHAYHVMPKSVSKHGAIIKDLATRGLASANAIAVGDSATDIEMSEGVGLMAVVRNGWDDPRVRTEAAARPNVYVTDGMRGEGWAELAELWLAAVASSPGQR